MNIITETIAPLNQDQCTVVNLPVDRTQLAKRRWRGTASDGTEFGFNLESPLSHQDAFFQVDQRLYQIEQLKEPVFLVPYQSVKESAWMGWMVGNLHFPASFSEDGLLVQNDLAVRQMLERNHISFHEEMRVFAPQTASGGHHHHHHHDHE